MTTAIMSSLIILPITEIERLKHSYKIDEGILAKYTELISNYDCFKEVAGGDTHRNNHGGGYNKYRGGNKYSGGKDMGGFQRKPSAFHHSGNDKGTGGHNKDSYRNGTHDDGMAGNGGANNRKKGGYYRRNGSSYERKNHGSQHHLFRENKPKDFHKQLKSYLNKINQANYDKILSKIRLIINLDNIDYFVTSIIDTCMNQNTYMPCLTQLLDDLTNLSGYKKEIKHRILHHCKKFIEDKQYIIPYEKYNTDKVSDYDKFCMITQHKKRTVNMIKMLVHIWKMYPSLLENNKHTYMDAVIALLNDQKADDTIASKTNEEQTKIDETIDLGMNMLNELLTDHESSTPSSPTSGRKKPNASVSPLPMKPSQSASDTSLVSMVSSQPVSRSTTPIISSNTIPTTLHLPHGTPGHTVSYTATSSTTGEDGSVVSTTTTMAVAATKKSVKTITSTQHTSSSSNKTSDNVTKKKNTYAVLNVVEEEECNYNNEVEQRELLETTKDMYEKAARKMTDVFWKELLDNTSSMRIKFIVEKTRAMLGGDGEIKTMQM
jgi:hypothetical protein